MCLPIFTKVKVELCRFELAKCLPTKEDLILSLSLSKQQGELLVSKWQELLVLTQSVAPL